jgi:hypothetical protein
MPFDRTEVSLLLAAVHRRCCICHRFCGFKMETDHMLPKAEGGSDKIENAIPVCFECHAEIHAYNVMHPRGRRFTEEELRVHKEQWLRICKESPGSLISSESPDSDVGPLNALVSELEFNAVVATRNADARVEGGRGASFLGDQFKRCIQLGSILLLDAELKSCVMRAYAAMDRANVRVRAEIEEPIIHPGRGNLVKGAGEAVIEAKRHIDDALAALSEYLTEGMDS